MIEANGLTKHYEGYKAVDNASFKINKGEVVGFLGPNGAGKSTTMKMLTCFIAPTAGEAIINGCNIWSDPLGVRQAIGYLPESTPLYPEMMVVEYLEFMAQMRGVDMGKRRARMKKVVEQTALGDVLTKHIRELSKGYKQRVGLAQALIHEPPVLILDEPMSGLDPNQAVGIRDLIREIGKERTVVLSTHNLAEVQVTCQRVLIIAKGKLVADDKPETLSGGSNVKFVLVVPRADVSKAKAAFEGLSAVVSVREKDMDSSHTSALSSNETQLEVLPKHNEDLRAKLFQAAVESGITLLEIKRVGENLEDVFRNLTLGTPLADKPTNDQAA